MASKTGRAETMNLQPVRFDFEGWSAGLACRNGVGILSQVVAAHGSWYPTFLPVSAGAPRTNATEVCTEAR